VSSLWIVGTSLISTVILRREREASEVVVDRLHKTGRNFPDQYGGIATMVDLQSVRLGRLGIATHSGSPSASRRPARVRTSLISTVGLRLSIRQILMLTIVPGGTSLISAVGLRHEKRNNFLCGSFMNMRRNFPDQYGGIATSETR